LHLNPFQVEYALDTRKVLEAIDNHFPQTLERVQEFLRQPSISTTGEGINRTAHTVASLLEDLGFQTDIYPTPTNPLILAKYSDVEDRAPTLLIHATFDVMTPQGEEWSSPPFAAEVRDHPRFGPCLFARGAYTQKAALMALLQALQVIREAGEKPPVNLTILVDSEEESGSPSLPDFVQQHREELAQAQAVYYPMFATDRRGFARIFLGTKGLVFLRLRTRSPSRRSLHSAEVGWIRNPAHTLIRALSSLMDEQGRPALPGLERDVKPPSPSDSRLLARLAQSFDPGVAALQLDANQLSHPLDSMEELLRRYLFQPSINISGLQTGYVGPYLKTILPREAQAHVDIRLTPNMRPSRVIQAVRDHLANLGLSELVEVEVAMALDWAKSGDDTPIARALLKSYFEAGADNVEIWPMFPASVPLHVYSKPPLNLPFAIGGLGHGGHAHSRDEYVVVEGIRQFQKGFIHLLQEFRRTSGTLPTTTGERPGPERKRRRGRAN